MVETRVQRAWVGLGSNLDHPRSQLGAARDGLARLPKSRLVRASCLYRTPPWGQTGQPAFINGVVELETALDATALLGALLAMERAAGRQREGPRWGPRRIDLDLLMLGNEIRQTDPILPHPRMHQRAFVLVPLAELRPDLEIPGCGTVNTLLSGLSREGIEPVAPDPSS